jgi:hypothetical protein
MATVNNIRRVSKKLFGFVKRSGRATVKRGGYPKIIEIDEENIDNEIVLRLINSRYKSPQYDKIIDPLRLYFNKNSIPTAHKTGDSGDNYCLSINRLPSNHERAGYYPGFIEPLHRRANCLARESGKCAPHHYENIPDFSWSIKYNDWFFSTSSIDESRMILREYKKEFNRQYNDHGLLITFCFNPTK